MFTVDVKQQYNNNKQFCRVIFVYFTYALCIDVCICHALLVLVAWNEDEKHCLVFSSKNLFVLVLFYSAVLWTVD